jgi:hypothetical protein
MIIALRMKATTNPAQVSSNSGELQISSFSQSSPGWVWDGTSLSMGSLESRLAGRHKRVSSDTNCMILRAHDVLLHRRLLTIINIVLHARNRSCLQDRHYTAPRGKCKDLCSSIMMSQLTSNCSCRKRDNVLDEYLSSPMPSPLLSPLCSIYDTPQYPHFDIVPQRSPTVLRPLSLSFAGLSMSEQDPRQYQDRDHRHDPRKLYETARSLTHLPGDYVSNQQTGQRRNHGTRASADSYIPSLSHTPGSSYGTLNSSSSYHQSRSARQPPFVSAFTVNSTEQVVPQSVTHAALSGRTTSVHHLRDASMKSSASTLTSFRFVEADRSSSGTSVRDFDIDEPGPPKEFAQVSGSLRRLYSAKQPFVSPRS